MKAAVLHQAHAPLAIEEFNMPIIDADDLLVQVAACGMCHTDIKVQEGELPARLPAVLGHEVTGIVAGVGGSHEGFFKEGDRVTVGMRYRCGRCKNCISGHENRCQTPPPGKGFIRPDGSEANRWNLGGFTQYMSIPGYMVYKIPDGVDLQEASVVGCRVTTAYNAVKNGGRIAPGESALVIGCGGIGLNVIQFLRLFGAYPIIAADIAQSKLDAAKQFGATHTIDASKEDTVEAAKEITQGGADKTFEAIGNPVTADQIVRATRAGGTATIVGALIGQQLLLKDAGFAFREVTITGVAARRTTDVIEVLDIIQQGRIDVSSLVTKRYGFEDINTAIDDVNAGNVLMGITIWN